MLAPAGLLLVASVIAAPDARALTVRSNVLVGEGLQAVIRTLDAADSTVPGVTVTASASGTRAPFEGSGSASARAQFLRTSATGSMTGTEFDESYDFDEDIGVPPVYAVQSLASFTETLAYGGTARNYTSRYLLRLTGNISGAGAFALVDLTHGSESSESWFYASPGAYNELIVSETYVGGNVPEFFSLQIISGYNADLSTLGGQSSSGSSSFGNTLELVGIELRDAETGLLAPQGTVVGSSGTVYPIIDIASIPEPASAVLLAIGGLSIGSLRRRD